jgi:hypothetical protein
LTYFDVLFLKTCVPVSFLFEITSPKQFLFFCCCTCCPSSFASSSRPTNFSQSVST